MECGWSNCTAEAVVFTGNSGMCRECYEKLLNESGLYYRMMYGEDPRGEPWLDRMRGADHN